MYLHFTLYVTYLSNLPFFSPGEVIEKECANTKNDEATLTNIPRTSMDLARSVQLKKEADGAFYLKDREDEEVVFRMIGVILLPTLVPDQLASGKCVLNVFLPTSLTEAFVYQTIP